MKGYYVITLVEYSYNSTYKVLHEIAYFLPHAIPVIDVTGMHGLSAFTGRVIEKAFFRIMTDLGKDTADEVLEKMMNNKWEQYYFKYSLNMSAAGAKKIPTLRFIQQEFHSRFGKMSSVNPTLISGVYVREMEKDSLEEYLVTIEGKDRVRAKKIIYYQEFDLPRYWDMSFYHDLSLFYLYSKKES